MPLPPLIEIVPPEGPVSARITVPGSKSITNRALILAALGPGTTTLRDALWSEDTHIMITALETLGFSVRVAQATGDPGNRDITVVGRGGEVPAGGPSSAPTEIHVGNSGTSARFLAALVCLGSGHYRISGVPRMHERPQAALLQALRALGYQIQAEGDHLPAVITGGGHRAGACSVDVSDSSQFASAMLLSAAAGGWTVDIQGASSDHLPYVDMTRALVEAFPGAGNYAIEPDASGGSYFWAAGWLLNQRTPSGGSDVSVSGWPTSGWQIDARYVDHLPPPETISRERDLGDSIMTAMVTAPFATRTTRFTELGRLRVQECERVVAMKTELSKCGVRVVEEGDTLVIEPGPVRGAAVDTYADHRVAMCLATLGLVTTGMRIHDPICVAKTFPTFFEKLAAPPPVGLGAKILDSATGDELRGDDLFAATNA